MRALLAVIAILGVVGCGDDAGPQAQAPSGGGGRRSDAGTTPRPGVIPGGSGSTPQPDAGDVDGGLEDVGDLTAGECVEVEAVKNIGEGIGSDTWYNAIVDPADFGATRIVTTWGEGCAPPTIQIVMSDGFCPDGRGHELRFELSTEAIGDGSLHLGQNIVLPEPATDGLRIRYVRPPHLARNGEFGTCDGVLGTLDLVQELSVAEGSFLRGYFQLELAPCDGSGANAVPVIGQFEGELKRGLDEVCPTSM